MKERVVRIHCQHESLLGILHSADAGPLGEQPARAVLILVGGPQYRVGSHRQFVLAARYIAANGYPVLRFDFRGMGDSTGAAPGFEHVANDVHAAINTLFEECPALRSICVFGLCDAASAVLLHCTTDPRVDSLVIANPWVRTEARQAAAFVKHYYGHRLLQKSFWRKLISGGLSPYKALRGLHNSIRASRTASSARQGFIDGMLDGLRRFQGPVLFISSGRDMTAREFDDLCTSDAQWAAAITAPSVQRLDLPATDHTFSNREGLTAANAAITAFLADRRGFQVRTAAHLER